MHMLTDYHSHVLPGIDDGAKDVEMSLSILDMMHKQGVKRVIATPHFYAHREKSVEAYLKQRQAAFEKIKRNSPIENIVLGSEVAIEHDISQLSGIEKLAIQGTNLILLELPYRQFENWMIEEINSISYTYKLTVLCAHVHRYVYYYSTAEMQTVLRLKAIFQINHDAFENIKERKLVRSIIKNGYPVAIGSDAHNLGSRKPRWDMLKKKCKPDVIEKSDMIFEQHLLG